MDTFCPYTFAIKQIVTQSCITKRFDNIFTRTPVGTEIPLCLGYTLTIVSATCASCVIRLSNPIYIPDINFNIPNNSYKVFDLPVESGCYCLHIAARLAPVETFCCLN